MNRPNTMPICAKHFEVLRPACATGLGCSSSSSTTSSTSGTSVPGAGTLDGC
ncbi:hypothetical protein HMPREF9440_01764 [Sutterella parvirubra YIT 11816]|uniref:Uncharacterized protein n=1 Tax=Sutterella parvirubra YIT 11816 TaxID=762967 RepID=H3KG85_9BURK|nr:hypothetical protein HMPREF9440_01764 [Sutterella parvirubra YIT 11816]